MLISVLASGSKGNCVYVKSDNCELLIDAGMNIKYLEEKLNELNSTLNNIKYILISHTHSDHIGAIQNIIKKYNTTLVLTEKMLLDMDYLKDYDNIFLLNDKITLADFDVESIKTSHDTSDSRGFVITCGQASLVNITDTGYLNQRFFSKIKNKNVYIFESNHDVEKLLHGRYPGFLKQRVLSDVGHLSNEASSYYLSKIIGSDTKRIYLAHLSEENNTPEIALKTIYKTFSENGIVFDDIIPAKQYDRTEEIIL